MTTAAPARSRRLALALLVALALLACVAAGVLVARSSLLPGSVVRSLKPVGSLTCQRYVATSSPRGSYCAWYMGAQTILFVQGPPEQVIASYAHRQFTFQAGPIQFAIGAQTTEDDNPQPPPLFPVYFGFSLFLEGLP